MTKEETQRLERLESNMTFLERQFDELNQVVIEQGRALKKLMARQQQLAESVRTAELERIRSVPTKPPHYQ